jgi:hypothetical protein
MGRVVKEGGDEALASLAQCADVGGRREARKRFLFSKKNALLLALRLIEARSDQGVNANAVPAPAAPPALVLL